MMPQLISGPIENSSANGMKEEFQRLAWLLSKIQSKYEANKIRFCFCTDCWGLLVDGYSFFHSRYISDLIQMEEWVQKKCQLNLVELVAEPNQPVAFTEQSAKSLEDYLMEELAFFYNINPDKSLMLVFDLGGENQLLCGAVCRGKLVGEMDEAEIFFQKTEEAFYA